MNQEYIKAVTQLGRPIPGQSLTNDPDNPAPYEKPPEFTSVHAASEFIFEKLINEEVYPQMMGLLADDVPIMDIVRTTLFAGFTEGKWNPDLMLMLVEPVAYMLLALAERAEIDPVIYRGEDEDEDEEERILGTKYEREKLKSMKKVLSSRSVPTNVIAPEILQQIEQLPVPSLMEQQPTQEETQTPETAGSLLSAPAPTEEEMQ
jgi:hypothetical protein